MVPPPACHQLQGYPLVLKGAWLWFDGLKGVTFSDPVECYLIVSDDDQF